MFWYMSEHANTRTCQWAWLVIWVSDFDYFSSLSSFGSNLFFSDFQCIQCIQLLLIFSNKWKICSDWRRKHGEKWPMLMTFFLTAIAAITGILKITTQKSQIWFLSFQSNQLWIDTACKQSGIMSSAWFHLVENSKYFIFTQDFIPFILFLHFTE